MNRGDILAKLQSTSGTETCTLSMNDGTANAAAAAAAAAALSIQKKADANVLNAFDAQSVFKLISSASDLEQHYDSDRECDDSGKNETNVKLFDMQSTTKNKRKNFKPRNAQTNATTADGDHQSQQQQQQQQNSLTDQFLLNLMMQNKMKQLQQELHQGQLKRWLDDGRTSSIEHFSSASSEHGEHRTMPNSDDSNHIAHIKSPPSSPLTNGHLPATGGKHTVHFILYLYLSLFLLHFSRIFLFPVHFIENAYNVVQDFLSVYGLTMSTNDILDAFNKKNDATAVSIRDLANSCKYLIVSFVFELVRVFFPLNHSIDLQFHS